MPDEHPLTLYRDNGLQELMLLVPEYAKAVARIYLGLLRKLGIGILYISFTSSVFAVRPYSKIRVSCLYKSTGKRLGQG